MVELKHHFDDAFFAEETRSGYLVTREVKQLWAVELDMLYELDRVCRALGIRYFLDSGTLLGAVRHKGFIPWDDDIDVAMLRADYDRFVREAPAQFEHPYFLQTAYTEPGYVRGHCQLRRSDTCGILPGEIGKVHFNQGLFLDVLVLDGMRPEKLEEQYRRKAEYRKIFRRLLHPESGSAVKRLAKRVMRPFYGEITEYYAQMEDIFRAEDDADQVGYVMFYSSAEANTIIFDRASFDETVYLPFEDGQFPVPKGYDRNLRAEYGENYMTPKQVSNYHNLNGQMITSVDESYTEVLKRLKPQT